jgi:hypothetical protein
MAVHSRQFNLFASIIPQFYLAPHSTQLSYTSEIDITPIILAHEAGQPTDDIKIL